MAESARFDAARQAAEDHAASAAMHRLLSWVLLMRSPPFVVVLLLRSPPFIIFHRLLSWCCSRGRPPIALLHPARASNFDNKGSDKKAERRPFASGL